MCLFHELAGTVEQIRQLPELFRGKVAQLAAMQFVHGLIQFVQQPESFRGDARLNNAAVLRFPRAGDQSRGFHSVEQASDIRIARDKPPADLAAGQALFPRASQDAQDVVLRSGEAVGLEQGLGAASQGVGGAHKADEDLGFEAGLRIAFRFGGSLHEETILVTTTIVKRNVAAAFLCVLCVKRFALQNAKSLTQRTRRSAEKTGEFVDNAGSYGFRVGRMCTSLMKLPEACVTRAATACATSSGWRIFEEFLPPCPENSVATEPGQMALTRMPYPRKSSAMLPDKPMSPHFDAQ